MEEKTRIRDASLEDVAIVSQCVIAAAHLSDFAPESEYDEEFIDICSREDTLYSYRHARVLTVEDIPVGCMVSYAGDIYEKTRRLTFGLFTDVSEEVSEATTDTECYPGEWYLDSLAIMPAHRHSGLGTLLVRDAIQTGRSHGYSRFSLIVERDNPHLQAFYASFGFTPREPLMFFGEPYVRMVLEG